MQRNGEVRDQELAWTQTGYCHGEYELRADDEIVAMLRWQGGGFAIAETADGRWSFERPGFGRSPVSVRDVRSGVGIAAFGSNWKGGGTLDVPRGRRFLWTPANFWRSRWVWRQEGRTALMSLESRHRIVKAEGRVRLERAALALPERGLLVTLGWYLLVMRARDSTTDAVATTAGTAGS